MFQLTICMHNREKIHEKKSNQRQTMQVFPAFLPVSMDSYNIRFTNIDEYTRSSTNFTQSIHSTINFSDFYLHTEPPETFSKRKN